MVYIIFHRLECSEDVDEGGAMVLREPTDDFGTKQGSIEPCLIISCDDNTLVRSLDCYWNQFVPSLYLLHDKLAKLGVLVDDELVQ